MSFSSVTEGLKFGAAIKAKDIIRTNRHVAGCAVVPPGEIAFCKRFKAAFNRSFSI